jgi:hypothetical protein
VRRRDIRVVPSNHEHEKIVAAVIGPYPRRMPLGILDPLPRVVVTTELGFVVELFEFYPDEISFSEFEFVGKTVSHARGLKGQKDSAHLRGRENEGQER